MTSALLTALLLALTPSPSGLSTSAPPAYTAIYDRGVPFAQFLGAVKELEDEWQGNFAGATFDEATLARARALKAQWRILVVAEDWCHDSVNTVPYLAKLVAEFPETLSMRVVRKRIGQPVLTAHRTADGRGATPTIVILDAEGGVKGVIVERPAALLEYSKEHSSQEDRRRWYAEDQGRHAVAELLDLIEK
jgi:hypothetical protein